MWIEVKSTTGIGGRFHWPKAEFEKALIARDRYILCRVYEAHTSTPTIKRFRDPVGRLLDGAVRWDVAALYAEIEPKEVAEPAAE